MVAQVAGLVHALAEALDLLNVVDLEDPVVAGALGFKEQSDEDGPLGVGVDAAAGAAAGEGGEEERGALGRLVDWGRPDVGALLECGLLGGEGEDVDVGGLHELLLDARGGEIDKAPDKANGISGDDVVASMHEGGGRDLLVSNGAAPSCASDPAQCPEFGAERWDEVGGMVWVVRDDQLVGILNLVGSHYAIARRGTGLAVSLRNHPVPTVSMHVLEELGAF
ncbi:unnamed protein product [Clonostachys solani]|uniref:Uncharacterized protein n=1 Tax=Clonostachys solani TaxID=160281 RepID=A0A9N9Z5X8_9HYPO|nr:unnamed protein product [Clonostachys solani]